MNTLPIGERHRKAKVANNPDLGECIWQNAKSMIAYWDNEGMANGFRQAIAFVVSKGCIVCDKGHKASYRSVQ